MLVTTPWTITIPNWKYISAPPLWPYVVQVSLWVISKSQHTPYHQPYISTPTLHLTTNSKLTLTLHFIPNLSPYTSPPNIHLSTHPKSSSEALSTFWIVDQCRMVRTCHVLVLCWVDTNIFEYLRFGLDYWEQKIRPEDIFAVSPFISCKVRRLIRYWMQCG